MKFFPGANRSFRISETHLQRWFSFGSHSASDLRPTDIQSRIDPDVLFAQQANTQLAKTPDFLKAEHSLISPDPSARSFRPAFDDVELAPFPRPQRGEWIPPALLFIVMVLLPVLGLLFYFVERASPQYFSEFRFSVESISQAANTSAGSPMDGSMASSLVGSLTGIPTMGSGMQNFIVVDYLKSRQAVDEVSSQLDLRRMFSAPSVDWWSRLDPKATPEQLVKYWNTMVSANYDPLTGIASAQVRAYTPEDALAIAQTLVKLSEQLVNNISRRAQEDSVRFAEDEVARAQANLDKIRDKLAVFREREGVIDPNPSIVSSNTQLSSSLRDTLSQLRTELASSQKQQVQSDSPQIVVLKSKIAATEEQLTRIEQEVAHSRGGKGVLAGVVARFEALTLDRQHAETLLLSSLQSLDRARANAAAQHLYLTPHVRPALAGSPAGPFVLKYMTLATLALISLWLLTLLTFRSVKRGLIR